LRTPNPFSARFIEAAMQAGIPFNRDFNGAEQDGAGYYQVTQRNGERWNSARAYLHHGDANDGTFSGGRRNLTVWPTRRCSASCSKVAARSASASRAPASRRCCARAAK
jgi:choline dehydrogenase-like flavoprotein